MADLTLLDDVTWRGAPIPSARAQALLAALVAAEPVRGGATR
jgi:hypothetical protein